jgi:hypothetical protein
MNSRKLLRNAFLAAIMLVMGAEVGVAQDWSFGDVFPKLDQAGVNVNARRPMHGVAVDKNGRIWLQPNASLDTLRNNGVNVLVRGIRVYNPDGTEASFSPITHFTVDGVADTLRTPYNGNALTGVGMNVDHNGNVLAAFNNRLYRFNADNGAAMNRYISPIMRTETIPHYFTKPAVTADGDIILTFVFGGSPIIILDADFNELGQVSPAKNGFNRTVEVSADGKRVYHPAYSAKRIEIYASEDGVFGEYARIDTVSLAGPATESMQRHPVTGDIWFSGGSVNDLPVDGSGYESFVYYSLNQTTGVITKRLSWNKDVAPQADPRPRGLAFNKTGTEAYVLAFGLAGIASVQRFTGTGVNLESDFADVPEGYTLAQNYPNPFNPSTQIKFEIADNANVILTVYDMLGRVVANLVNTRLQAGTHLFNFDAKNLASGIYLYELKTDNGVRLTNKMTLVK